jgi:cation diffusion facilitator family transporter
MVTRDNTVDYAEKNRIALGSLATGVVLSAVKLVAGLLTGSLGLLSEAAHSGLDALASLITAISVRVSERPPDADHPYGHGRFENLSATVQGLLLFGTGGAIILESVRRLTEPVLHVRPSPWAFVIMAASIVVDLWRSRMLSRAARKYNSRALEADALNFRADLFTSVVVLVGLALTSYAEMTGADGVLLRADAAAALVVALFIIGMAAKLAIAAVNVLTDRASGELGARMTRAAADVPGVLVAHPVRMRESGHHVFADVVVTTTRTLSLAQAHEITERIEEAIGGVEPRAEVLVHIEPTASFGETTTEAIRAIALRLGIATHHEQVYDVAGGLEAVLHIEVEPRLTLTDAHAQAERLADTLTGEVPGLRRVATHIEAAEPNETRRREVTSERRNLVALIREIVLHSGTTDGFEAVRLYASDDSTCDAVLSCVFRADLLVGDIHRRTEQLEQELRERIPTLGRVIIHAEPAELDTGRGH